MFDARNDQPAVDCLLKGPHLLLDRFFDPRDLGGHMIEIFDLFEHLTRVYANSALLRVIEMGSAPHPRTSRFAQTDETALVCESH